jgi:hypothetical protein
VFASIAGSILIPYSQLSFELEAITKLVKIKSKFGPPNFNFCEKFKLILKISSNKQLKELHKHGSSLLEQNFDLIRIFVQLREISSYPQQVINLDLNTLETE